MTRRSSSARMVSRWGYSPSILPACPQISVASASRPAESSSGKAIDRFSRKIAALCGIFGPIQRPRRSPKRDAVSMGIRRASHTTSDTRAKSSRHSARCRKRCSRASLRSELPTMNSAKTYNFSGINGSSRAPIISHGKPLLGPELAVKVPLCAAVAGPGGGLCGAPRPFLR